MDKTRLKLAAFFDQDDDDPVSQKPLANEKLSQYAQGTVRKSRREKEKEAADARRRAEEESAARAYAEFVDAFEGEGTKPKAGGGFVRPVAESGGVYAPEQAKAAGVPSSRTSAMFERDTDEIPITAPRKGKRAMDAFLDEIKRDQAEREARYSRQGHAHGRSATAMAAYEGQSGSKDRGDPETSNLFVANLPQNVTEQTFGQFFARHGPVGSLKIMWPRSDGPGGPAGDMNVSRRSKNSGFSGFISFMKRKDAEMALRELDGYNWGGSVLRVGWSKAVPMAAKPLYGAARSRSRSPERSRKDHSPHSHRRRSRSRSRDRRHEARGSRRDPSRSRSRSPRRGYRQSRSRSRDRSRHRHGRRSRSRSPRRRRSGSRHRRGDDANDTVSDSFVRTVAAQVKGNDAAYEDNLREREKSNAQYAFLTDDHHRKSKYYRSLLDRRSPLSPEFEDEGYNSVCSTDSAEESEREHGRKHELGRLARRRFAGMLRAMSGKRGDMARCMAFSLEHAEAAAEVADIIVASLLVDGTPVPRKVSRLHLICDILHNSAVPLPGAWRFRQEFQTRLGLVFDHLASIYHSFPGRITADTFKKQITAVVDIWEDWIVFPPEFTAGLRARLEGSVAPQEEKEEEVVVEAPVEPPKAESKFKASSFKPADAVPGAPSEAVSDGEPMDEGSDTDAEPGVSNGKLEDDLDGAPLEDDLDGEPMDDIDGAPVVDDIDGAPVDDIDGIPMHDINGELAADDADGEPMNEDIDGAPVHV